MRESSIKEFEFKNVVTLKPAILYTIVLLVITLFLGLYYLLMGIDFNLFFLIFTFALIVVGITLILKVASSTVRISFTENTTLINIRNRITVYKKTDFRGLYSIDYSKSKSSRIAFELLLGNGQKIFFTDIEFADKRDAIMNEKLKEFLKTIGKELDLAVQKKSTRIEINRIGKTYFSKIK